MYICTNFDVASAIYAANAPRDVMDIMRETYPDATMDDNGRLHAPCDGYVCPITGNTFRGGEYLPTLSADDYGYGESSSIHSVAALYNGEFVEWDGTRGQIKAVSEELQRQTVAVDVETSRHVGKEKQRIRIRVHVCFVRAFEGVYGCTFFHSLRSEDGNIFVYKGSKNLGSRVKPGDTLEIVATVKGHGEYKGIKQTTIARPKVV